MSRCRQVLNEFKEDIDEVVRAQKDEHREAIFFIYEDGTTSDVLKGSHDNIKLSKEQENAIFRDGNVVSSVHSHPSGFDPSTIDIMTGIMSEQDYMCIATPAYTPDNVEEDYVLTCIEMDHMSAVQKERLMRAMRRSTIGVTDFGRVIRKQKNIDRFEIKGCRSTPVGDDNMALSDSTSSIISEFSTIV